MRCLHVLTGTRERLKRISVLLGIGFHYRLTHGNVRPHSFFGRRQGIPLCLFLGWLWSEAFAAVRQIDRLYRDFRTQIPGVPVYLASLHFRHEVLHGERAESDCQPNFRYVRRESLPQVSLTTKVFAKYHSHPLAAWMTLVYL